MSTTPESPLERLIAHLEQELEEARLRERAARADQEAARDREVRLWRLLEERRPRQSPENATAAPARSFVMPVSAWAFESEPITLTRRQRIIQLLEQNPRGLHRMQLEEQIGMTRRLSDTLGHMKRAGLIIHRGGGVYALAPSDTALVTTQDAGKDAHAAED